MLLLALGALPLPAAAQKPEARRPAVVRGETPYATRDDAMRFADEVAARRNLDRDWVRATIGAARFCRTCRG